MDLTEIRKLVRLMLRADLSELEVDDTNTGCRVHLKRNIANPAGGGGGAPVVHFMPSGGTPVNLGQAAMGPGTMGTTAMGEGAVLPPGTEAFPSPMVGTFYRSPSPDSDPFVEVGDTFDEDKVICIIEAMKVMNEIRPESKGQIVEILVENGEPIEYGQPLFLIKKG